MPRKVAFLDRDGVINVDIGYLHRIEDLAYLPNALAGAARLVDLGYDLVVTTNQSGIGRGFYDAAAFETLMHRIGADFARNGAPLLAVYHCPHLPEAGCACRKPSPGMLLQAARDQDIDLAASVMIGDKMSDLQAARAAGVGRGILIGSRGIEQLGSNETAVPDLVAAADWIEARDGRPIGATDALK